MNSTTKRYLAEAFGTAVLVLVGCGAAAIGAADGRTLVDVIGIAFAFGLAVTAMAYGVGPISGCHINPAVTVGMLAAGRMSVNDAIGYIVSQLVGAVIGAALLVAILKGKLAGYDLAASGLGQNGWGEGYLGGYGLGAAMLTEFLATFVFVVVILSATNPTTTLEVAGLIIGLTLFMLHFPFINVTGLSVNPARSLGPAVFVGGKALAQVWMFLVVPTVAGAVAGWLFKAGLLAPEPPPSKA
ncbi:MAG TPA: aquaporin [Xanthobacteraceae bacterium]|nr:aquaporin [Xanthobacteraceae bacterium]